MVEYFTEDKRVQYILRERGITQESDVVRVLEQYKFTEDLYDRMTHRYPDRPVTTLDGVWELVDGKLNGSVLIQRDGSRTRLAVDVYCQSDLASVTLYLSDYTLYWVTPHHLAVLAGKQVMWDYQVLFYRILMEAISMRATDLHLTVAHVNQTPIYPIKCRIDGEYHDIDLFELTEQDNYRLVETLVKDKTSALSIDLTSKEGIVSNVTDIFGDGNTELRVCVNRVLHGYDCVCRIQQKSTFLFTVKDLGFPESLQDVLYRVSKKSSGITLITGAIRTGKNTTALAIANEMVKYPIKIKEIDSPIEVVMPYPQIDYYADEERLLSAVKLIKKQDVNVVILNEIPSSGVAFAVRDLVISSVHVITTIHLDRIWHLPYRLQEYYKDNFKDVFSQINCVINQKMFNTLNKEDSYTILVEDIPEQGERELLQRNGIVSVCVPKRKEAYCGNQPYAEYVWFDSTLKSEILACQYTWEMEQVIHRRVERDKTTLEDSMLNGIRQGRLYYRALEVL